MSGQGVHRRRRVVALAVLAALAVVVVVLVRACGGERGEPPAGAGATSLLDALAPVLGTGAKAGVPGEDDLGVPLDRAAAQLFLVGFSGTDAGAPFVRRRLRARDWGAVVLTAANRGGSRRGVRRLVRALRATAARAGHTPPLVAGVTARERGGPTVPDASARQLAGLGFHAVLGPPLDVGYAAGPWDARGLPEEDPGAAARRAVARWTDGGVLPVPGHFPGEGAASADPQVAPASVGLGLAELRATEVRPFAAVAPVVRAVQLSAAVYVAFDGVTPATLLPEAVRLLRSVDPDAVAVSADLQQVALVTGQPVADLAVQALAAGCDLLHVPGDAADQEAAFRAVVRAIRTGALPAARVRDALARLATLKRRAGVVGPGAG